MKFLKTITIIALCSVFVFANVKRNSILNSHNNHTDGYHGTVFIIGKEITSANSLMIDRLGIASEFSASVISQRASEPAGYTSQEPEEKVSIHNIGNKKLFGYLTPDTSQTRFDQVALTTVDAEDLNIVSLND